MTAAVALPVRCAPEEEDPVNKPQTQASITRKDVTPRARASCMTAHRTMPLLPRPPHLHTDVAHSPAQKDARGIHYRVLNGRAAPPAVHVLHHHRFARVGVAHPQAYNVSGHVIFRADRRRSSDIVAEGPATHTALFKGRHVHQESPACPFHSFGVLYRLATCNGEAAELAHADVVTLLIDNTEKLFGNLSVRRRGGGPKRNGGRRWSGHVQISNGNGPIKTNEVVKQMVETRRTVRNSIKNNKQIAQTPTY